MKLWVIRAILVKVHFQRTFDFVFFFVRCITVVRVPSWTYYRGLLIPILFVD